MNLFQRSIVLIFYCFLIIFILKTALPWVIESSYRIVLFLLFVLGHVNLRTYIIEMVVDFLVNITAQMYTRPFRPARLPDAVRDDFESSPNESLLSEIREKCRETDIKVTEFDWDTIVAGTDNFSDLNLVARGKSGTTTVHMASLGPSGKFAVKRFSPSSGISGLTEFKNEIFLLPKLEHPNIIKLIGYCIHGQEKLLVHEYMLPSCLDTLLQISSKHKDELRSFALNQWPVRFKLIIGIAEGVAYLHEYSGLGIVHRDLNLSNILVDESMMNPKIFGFASAKSTIGMTGNMFREYNVKMKSDIYCFGLIVLVMMSGKIVTTMSEVTSLVDNAKMVRSIGTISETVEDSLIATYVPDEARKCLEVGVLCTQQDPYSRPTITSVLEILRGNYDGICQ